MEKYNLTSHQFAAINQVKAEAVRSRLSLTGSYFGIVPRKLANGRLSFPDVQVCKVFTVDEERAKEDKRREDRLKVVEKKQTKENVRCVHVYLNKECLNAAEKIGNGKVSRGIRKALMSFA